MKPLDPLLKPEHGDVAEASAIERCLRSAPPAEVEQELQRLADLPLSPRADAARRYAVAALALRVGRLEDARLGFEECADLLAPLADPEAHGLCVCEWWLSRIRLGPRTVYDEADRALATLATEQPDSPLIQVVARHYRATALRFAGRAEATLELLLEAFERSDGWLVERGQVLNSLGTLYQVMGAYGAAHEVLEYAAEINHQVGDRVSEAIAYGQLGSAALARGELDEARQHLQRQEWLASNVGDRFGQARALVMLADVALTKGRPDDALELADQGRAVAESVSPPLRMWVAYAQRSRGRALVELGDARAEAAMEDAQVQFDGLGNALGAAFVTWDRARAGRRLPGDQARADDRRDGWQRAAWSLASLGLSGRVTQLLRDMRDDWADDADERRRIDMMVAASGQSYPHLTTAHEVDLVFSEPETLASIAARRIAGQRNLGRLAALRLQPDGLVVAAVTAPDLTAEMVLPTTRCLFTLGARLARLALLVWPSETSPALIAADLQPLRERIGTDVRMLLAAFPAGRLASTPFAGELGVDLQGVDVLGLARELLELPPGALRRRPDLAWDDAAAALLAFDQEASS